MRPYYCVSGIFHVAFKKVGEMVGKSKGFKENTMHSFVKSKPYAERHVYLNCSQCLKRYNLET